MLTRHMYTPGTSIVVNFISRKFYPPRYFVQLGYTEVSYRTARIEHFSCYIMFTHFASTIGSGLHFSQ